MAVVKANKEPDVSTSNVSTLRWLTGMMISSIFSLVYLVTPLYLLASLACLVFQFPSTLWSFVLAGPMILSMVIKPISCQWLLGMLTPMLDYFDYEQIIESTPINARKEMIDGNKNYILAFQPHGVVCDNDE